MQVLFANVRSSPTTVTRRPPSTVLNNTDIVSNGATSSAPLLCDNRFHHATTSSARVVGERPHFAPNDITPRNSTVPAITTSPSSLQSHASLPPTSATQFITINNVTISPTANTPQTVLTIAVSVPCNDRESTTLTTPSASHPVIPVTPNSNLKSFDVMRRCRFVYSRGDEYNHAYIRNMCIYVNAIPRWRYIFERATMYSFHLGPLRTFACLRQDPQYEIDESLRTAYDEFIRDIYDINDLKLTRWFLSHVLSGRIIGSSSWFPNSPPNAPTVHTALNLQRVVDAVGPIMQSTRTGELVLATESLTGRLGVLNEIAGAEGRLMMVEWRTIMNGEEFREASEWMEEGMGDKWLW